MSDQPTRHQLAPVSLRNLVRYLLATNEPAELEDALTDYFGQQLGDTRAQGRREGLALAIAEIEQRATHYRAERDRLARDGLRETASVYDQAGHTADALALAVRLIAPSDPPP